MPNDHAAAQPAPESTPGTTDLSVLILHGWQNRRPVGHWHRWLADTLVAQGHQVVYPQQPEPDFPVLSDWVATAAAGFAELRGRQRLVVAHSLGCPTWLATAAADPTITADRLALVVPPSPALLAGIPDVAPFGFPADRPDLRSGATSGVVVHSDNDPYDPEGSGALWPGRLGLTDVFLPGQAHVNPDSGYGEWPAFLAWVLDPSSEITAR